MGRIGRLVAQKFASNHFQLFSMRTLHFLDLIHTQLRPVERLEILLVWGLAIIPCSGWSFAFESHFWCRTMGSPWVWLWLPWTAKKMQIMSLRLGGFWFSNGMLDPSGRILDRISDGIRRWQDLFQPGKSLHCQMPILRSLRRFWMVSTWRIATSRYFIIWRSGGAWPTENCSEAGPSWKIQMSLWN